MEDVNPLLSWINFNILYYNGNNAPVGNKTNSEHTHLYANYLKFCNQEGHTPLSIVNFTNALIQQLSVKFKSSNFIKKRTSSGFTISNIKLK